VAGVGGAGPALAPAATAAGGTCGTEKQKDESLRKPRAPAVRCYRGGIGKRNEKGNERHHAEGRSAHKIPPS